MPCQPRVCHYLFGCWILDWSLAEVFLHAVPYHPPDTLVVEFSIEGLSNFDVLRLFAKPWVFSCQTTKAKVSQRLNSILPWAAPYVFDYNWSLHYLNTSNNSSILISSNGCLFSKVYAKRVLKLLSHQHKVQHLFFFFNDLMGAHPCPFWIFNMIIYLWLQNIYHHKWLCM